MPIHVPGIRRGRGIKSKKRSAVAVLQLTAMVDMFTVLTVFLLQSYLTTGEIIDIPEDIVLPEAAAVKELKPANVVTVSRKDIMINQERVAEFIKVKEQKDWMIPVLFTKVQEVIKKGEKEKNTLQNKIRESLKKQSAKDDKDKNDVEPFRKITLQADQDIDYLTLKKVMYTATEAGMVEINFAVLKKDESEKNKK